VGVVNRKRVAIGALLSCALGLVCACLFVLYGLRPGEGDSLTTDTDSSQLKTSAERVAFLGRYLKLRTRVTDAAFHIVYHDNSHGLPGPSDWWIVAAVEVTPADGPTWLAGARPLSENDPFSAQLLPAKRCVIPAEWGVSSPGVSYARDGALLVWHAEGVLEFTSTTD
jgi:hypothetical protein